MVITEITAENLDWINQERKKRKINKPPLRLSLKSYNYIKENFYGTLSQQDYILVFFEKFKQLTNPQTKNQIIELW
jgi:hypothetical protein